MELIEPEFAVACFLPPDVAELRTQVSDHSWLSPDRSFSIMIQVCCLDRDPAGGGWAMNRNASNLESCSDCPIRYSAVCSRCEPGELARMEAAKRYLRFKSGERIVWAGDEMDFVASVVSGTATLSQTMEDGRTQMVGLMLPSDFLGRPGRSVAPYDVTAASDITLCCFRRKPFEEMMRQSPQIGRRLLEMTLDELDAARDWMLVLGRKTAREKIASLLLSLARRAAVRERAAVGDGVVLDLPISREAMADYLGLTLETVSRQITALKRDGVIALEGMRKVAVPDLGVLVQEAGASWSVGDCSGGSSMPCGFAGRA